MPDFLVQKFHPALQFAQRLTLLGSKCLLFSGMDAWGGDRLLHCAVMALALLGKLTDPAQIATRRRGPEARLWQRIQTFNWGDVRLYDLWNRLYELNWGLRPVLLEQSHRDLLRFCERELLQGRATILSWRERKTRSRGAALVIGVEGRMRGRRFESHALLLLDPSEPEPRLSSSNARLTYAGSDIDQRSRHALYVTADATRKVIVDGALSIRLANLPKTIKPP